MPQMPGAYGVTGIAYMGTTIGFRVTDKHSWSMIQGPGYGIQENKYRKYGCDPVGALAPR